MEKTKRFIIRREMIGFLKSILESYEDVGILSVLDGSKGLVEIVYPVFFQDDLMNILKDMENYGIDFREVDYD
ncbi:MAG TPA: DUF4911 domain-containing protein [Syntrophorhabdaceae bacterium]|nr:DUF4911 domain-containing protein [Syntrophorhabdaceae bacterium]